MALKFSVAVKNARLNAIETAIGTAPILKIRSGAAPVLITDADSGDVLAALTLPSDWMAAADAGAKAMAGTWQDLSADAAGTAGHFRIYASDGTTVHVQGSVSAVDGGGDMELINTSVAVGQEVSISGFTITDGN